MSEPRRVAVITGSRADFGLLAPVMRAVDEHEELQLLVIAAGAHLIQPALTFRDVKARFPVADSIPMQTAGRTGRVADVEAVGKGIARFGRSFERHNPDWVVVLGDRIEAFAAASAASIGGFALAHIHGGDRAEGVADEAMRHAITKLAHLHLAATQTSAERIRRMGERPEHVIVTGSPAIDGLDEIEPLSDEQWNELSRPTAIVLLHPIGRHAEEEEAVASEVFASLAGERPLVMHPNHDPGREGIIRAMARMNRNWLTVEHLPRRVFLAALRRLALERGVLVGNSSAGLIEAAALGVPVVNVGLRQSGRERPPNVVDVEHEQAEAIRQAIARARTIEQEPRVNPYGDGHAASRIADALARVNPRDRTLLRKHNTY